VPKYEDVTREYQVRVPVWREEQREYTVMVPHQETREATRRVVQCVPVTQTRTVCRDEGHWEERPADCCGASCGGCEDSCATPCCEEDPCGCCSARRSGRQGRLARRRARRAACCEPTKVWIPNIVQEEVEVAVMKRQCVDEPYTCTVTVCKPETRTKTVKLCSYKCETRTKTDRVCRYEQETRTRTRQVTECKLETRTRDVNYTVCVPQTKTTTHEVTTYKCVPEEKVEEYTVMVPHQVEKEVQVCVCKMVPKTIQVPAATCCDDACGSSCGRAKCRRARRSCGC
jgi:YTV protein